MIIPFEKLQIDQKFVGSKAYVLALMSQKNLNVPKGLIISAEIPNDEHWKLILQWWKENGQMPLAVRSSAYGEDSKEMSFAGQNLSFLNIRNEEELKKSVHACFSSIDRETSKAYRKFFQNKNIEVPMNVVLQEMVAAEYSGVYFSENPMNKEDKAILEYVKGYGESLVSGKVNPWRVYEKQSKSQTKSGPLDPQLIQSVFELGTKVSELLSEKIDMEWAISQEKRLYLLQARPITASRSGHSVKKIIHNEYERINKHPDPYAWWDGKTFCEWTGIPSQLSYDVWKKAFAPNSSLDKALQELGYLGFSSADFSPHESILDSLFGKPYVNMSQMLSLYFGPIPYIVNPNPKTHLEFKADKITFNGILRTPISIWKMFSVAWKISTQRRAYIQKAKEELVSFKNTLHRPESEKIYSTWDANELLEHWKQEVKHYSENALKWPLVTSILIDATLQSLEAITQSVLGIEKSKTTVRKWLGSGLQTLSFDMNQSFIAACNDPKKRSFFLSNFGHRGPGELDLSNPRWNELAQNAFDTQLKQVTSLKHLHTDIEDEVRQWKTLKQDIILEEWKLLKDLLELRELWKMETLKPYAHIRYITIELAKRENIGRDIFELNCQEIEDFFLKKIDRNTVDEIILNRKTNNQAFQSVSLPEIIKKSDLYQELYVDRSPSNSLKGLSLSGGLSKGRVRIIKSPEELVKSDLNEQTIIVAPATDPGWTPLLTHVKGIIVERGGVLSHCAIVAREMNIPALNLLNATKILKEGELITLDADKGNVRHELNI